jgi:hypothetical protein
MANMSLDEKNRTGTMVQRVPGMSILEHNGAALALAPEDPANVPNEGAIPRPRYTQDRTNISRRSLASHVARRLFILFDVAFTILLIVLLGDGEDDLRLHPAFVQAVQGWCRE